MTEDELYAKYGSITLSEYVELSPRERRIIPADIKARLLTEDDSSDPSMQEKMQKHYELQ